MNSNAVKFVQQFLKKNREDLAETVLRSQKLFPAMEAIFEKQDLPKQLKYLAVVESDLKVKARSNAGAIGYWQLMKETAIELGLKVNGETDDRKHLWRSTNAAAKYLKALYKEYDDWLLVIAAYNSGPGTINKAIKASGSRNFWRLQSYLPAETRGHVKRFIAIHYFFADAGSETTLTKAERLIYEKEMDRYNKLLLEENRSIDSTTSQPQIIKEEKFP
ncbi:MAG: lytic transglycosylase domain-containing protein [Chitinophagaceae bacterium]|nr:MAG: lytic transglycosylase domain-containing protein [Chitinophagaceae bacterium]